MLLKAYFAIEYELGKMLCFNICIVFFNRHKTIVIYIFPSPPLMCQLKTKMFLLLGILKDRKSLIPTEEFRTG